MAFPPVNGLPTAGGTPFHFKMVSASPLHTHPLEPFESHPRFPAGLEECLFGRKKFGKILRRKTAKAPPFGNVQEPITDVLPVTGKELSDTGARNQVHPNTPQRNGLLLYWQH